jgi:hypothetical protein
LQTQFLPAIVVVPVLVETITMPVVSTNDQLISYVETQTIQTIVPAVIDAKNFFKLLVQMRDRDMLPGIAFDNTDDIAWNSYINLIKFVETAENEDYKDYHKLVDKINQTIDKFNSERDSKLNDMPEDDITDSTKSRDGTGLNNRRDSGLRAITSMRINTFNTLIADAKTILTKSIMAFNSSEYDYTKCMCQILPNNPQIPLKNIASLLKITTKNIKLKYPNFTISHAHLDMIQIINDLEHMNSDQSEAINKLSLDVGSY